MKSRLEHIRSLFSLEVALNLVQMAKSSLDRVAIFASSPGEFQTPARMQCEKIFVLLVTALGTQHVKKGFDQAVDHLASYSPHGQESQQQEATVTPLATFLELVNVGDLIQQMLEVFYEQELVSPGLVDSGDFLNPAVKEKRRFEQMIDDRVAAGLNKGIDVLMAEVDHICSTTQKIKDYNPGASGSVVSTLVDISPTSTARSVVKMVSTHSQMLIGSADKTVLDVFKQEVGLRLFATLCKHLKRQRISLSGAVRLIRSAVLISISNKR